MTAYLKITREQMKLLKEGRNLTVNLKPGTTRVLIRIAQELRTETFLDELLTTLGGKR